MLINIFHSLSQSCSAASLPEWAQFSDSPFAPLWGPQLGLQLETWTRFLCRAGAVRNPSSVSRFLSVLCFYFSTSPVLKYLVANAGFDWVLQKVLLSSVHFFQAINRGCHVKLPLNKASAANPQPIYGAEMSHFKKGTFFFERNDLHHTLFWFLSLVLIFFRWFLFLWHHLVWFFLYLESQTLPCLALVEKRSRGCQECDMETRVGLLRALGEGSGAGGTKPWQPFWEGQERESLPESRKQKEPDVSREGQ